ncbi:MAG TPA: hypothetical protein VGB89_15115 [Bacteroidota bacterium]
MNSPSRLIPLPGALQDIQNAYHLAFYRAPRSGYQDTVSKSFELFKSSEEHHVRKWVELTAPIISAELSFTCIVRALDHDETVAGGTSSLDKLCEEVARRTEVSYCPERLHKTRTTVDMATLGGKQAKQAELSGVYQFNAEQLPENSRILIVEDLFTTGTTLEAIAGTIKAALPSAEIIAFAFVKRDANMSNSHLDAGYFFAGNDYAIPNPTIGVTEIQSEVIGSQTGSHLPRLADASHPLMRNGKPKTATASRPAFPKIAFFKNKKKASSLYVAAVITASTLLGAFVQFQSGQGVERNDDPLPATEYTEIVPETNSPTPEVVPPPKRVEFDRIGTITVPNVGLRTASSFNSKVVSRAQLRHGERVGIVKRVTPSHGPAWVQVKTRGGKSGWVLASVVREAAE